MCCGAPSVQRLIERQEFLVQVTLPSGMALASPPADAAVEAANRSRAGLRYVSAATRTDPHLQGMSFFYTVPGDSGLLPGMNVLALLPSDKVVEGTVIPESAVVRWQGKDWIYLRTDERTFARRCLASTLIRFSFVRGASKSGARPVVRASQPGAAV